MAVRSGQQGLGDVLAGRRRPLVPFGGLGVGWRAGENLLTDTVPDLVLDVAVTHRR